MGEPGVDGEPGAAGPRGDDGIDGAQGLPGTVHTYVSTGYTHVLIHAYILAS